MTIEPPAPRPELQAGGRVRLALYLLGPLVVLALILAGRLQSMQGFPAIFALVWVGLGVIWWLRLRRALSSGGRLLMVLAALAALMLPVVAFTLWRDASNRHERSALAAFAAVPVAAPRADWVLDRAAGGAGTPVGKARFTVVNFWATWCRPCVAEMPLLEQAHRELAARGVLMLGFTRLYATEPGAAAEGELQALSAFCNRAGVTYPILVERGHDTHAAYRVRLLPTTVLIDSGGRVLDYAIGERGAKRILRRVREAVGARG